MPRLQRSLLVIMIIMTCQVFAEQIYTPGSGDTALDNTLLQLNKTLKNNKKSFINKAADEFQVTRQQISELFSHYEFTPADVLMTLAIADVTGQPVNNISRAYFENKKLGWKFVLHQLNILKNSKQYAQIKKDAKAGFMVRN